MPISEDEFRKSVCRNMYCGTWSGFPKEDRLGPLCESCEAITKYEPIKDLEWGRECTLTPVLRALPAEGLSDSLIRAIEEKSDMSVWRVEGTIFLLWCFDERKYPTYVVHKWEKT